jgi:hypothetical protein
VPSSSPLQYACSFARSFSFNTTGLSTTVREGAVKSDMPKMPMNGTPASLQARATPATEESTTAIGRAICESRIWVRERGESDTRKQRISRKKTQDRILEQEERAARGR